MKNYYDDMIKEALFSLGKKSNNIVEFDYILENIDYDELIEISHFKNTKEGVDFLKKNISDLMLSKDYLKLINKNKTHYPIIKSECPICLNGKIKYMTEQYPYSEEHLYCNNCNSTFNIKNGINDKELPR